MATSNNRDVKMTLSVETLGTNEVDRLRSEIEALGKQGGDAAPQFKQLADEVAKLGQQAEALAGFQRLVETTDQLAQAQAQTSARITELTNNLTQARNVTQQAADAQVQAQAAYDSTQKRLKEINGELAVLRASYDAAGKKTDEYKNAVTTLINEKTELNTKTVDLRNELTASNKALAEAERAQNGLEKQLTRTNTSLENQNKKLADARQEQETAAAAVEKLGLSTTDVAQAQAQLVTALNGAGDAARNLKSGVDAAAEAERDLADQAELARQRLLDRNRAAQQAYEQDQQIAAQRIADLQRQAAAEKAAADAAIASKRAEQAESDRLYEIQRQTQQRLEIQARQALAAENQARREAADLAIRIENEKRAAIEQSARAQADAINNAFQTVGQRGASQLRAEIDKVRNAMQTLSTQAGLTGAELDSAMRAGNAQIQELERELRAVTGQMTLADRAAGLLSNSMGQIAAGNLIADGIASIVEKFKEMGRAFIQVNLQADTLRRGLNAIYKDVGITASQIDFLRNTATQAGVSISGITNDFVKFSAATKASNIPLQTTNEVFNAVTRAASSLGLGADKTSLALNALGQIASKGVVSMEELRQQLGDAVPGALSLTAKGLGITDAELIKLVESGQLASRDFFPAFARGLQELQGDTDGLRQSWERFKNSLTVSAQAVGEAGGLNLLSLGVKALSTVVGGATVILQGFFEVVSLGARVIGILAGAITTLTNPLEALNEALLESSIRQKAVNDAYLASIGIIDEKTAAESRLAAAKLKGRDAEQGQTEAIKFNTDAIAAQAAAAKNTEVGQAALARATQIAGDAGLDASAKWVKLNSDMVGLQKQQELNVSVSEKAAKATQIEGESLVALARLRGDELSLLEAEALAAQRNSQALATVATARQGEANVLAVQLKSMIDLANAQDGNTLARQSEIQAIQQKLVVAQEEAAAAQNAAANAQIEVAQRQLVIQSYRDNSAAVDQYKAALDAAMVTLEAVRAAEANGVLSKQAVEEAERNVATAAALYNDALRDRVTNANAAASAEKSLLDTKASNLRVSIEEIKAQIEVARARGENFKAMDLERQLRQLELQQLALTAEAKRAEAKATLSLAEATRASLIASNQWTAAAEAAYKASIAKANALENEAKIAEITAKKLQELADVTKKAGDSARTAAGDYDQLAGSIQNVADAADSVKPPANPNAGTAFGEATGYVPTVYSQVKQKLRAGTLEAGDIELVKRAVEEQQQLYDWSNSFVAGGAMGPRGSGSAALEEVRALYEDLKRQQAGSSASPAMSNAFSAPSANTTVTVNLNGASTRIGMASQQDANSLVSLLQQLETSAGRTY